MPSGVGCSDTACLTLSWRGLLRCCREEHEGHLEYDLGNLLVEDVGPVDVSALERDTVGTCQAMATRMFQGLLNRLFELPAEAVPMGRIAELPRPTTALPREKPLPTPRPPTKWEEFAQRKGIVKHKRSKLVLDEGTQEFKRRHGYGRANDESAIPIVEAGPDDVPGEDPFTRQRREKRDRVHRQAAAQAGNLQAAVNAGGKRALPPTLRLAATLAEDGRRGPIQRRREAKVEVRWGNPAGCEGWVGPGDGWCLCAFWGRALLPEA